jgi:hypothetical protein
MFAIVIDIIMFFFQHAVASTSKSGAQTKILTFDTFQEIFRENAEATGKAVELLKRIDDEAAAALAASTVSKKAHRFLPHSASSGMLVSATASAQAAGPPPQAALLPPQVASSETSAGSGSARDAPAAEVLAVSDLPRACDSNPSGT